MKLCNCGSKKESYWTYDAQGIPLRRVCESCEKDKLSGYRPEILSGYDQGDVAEPIEPEPCVGPRFSGFSDWY